MHDLNFRQPLNPIPHPPPSYAILSWVVLRSSRGPGKVGGSSYQDEGRVLESELHFRQLQAIDDARKLEVCSYSDKRKKLQRHTAQCRWP